MHRQLGPKYVGDAIDELTTLLGVKEEIAPETILNIYRSQSAALSIEHMAGYLGLPIKVNIVMVSATYGQKDGIHFTTRGLANTDDTGKATESITAQVLIPGHLPFYGSELLRGFPMTVRISDDCYKDPISFFSIMAHELSHVVLHSLLSPHKENEVYTDLAAMILGFSSVMKDGRKVVKVDQQAYHPNPTTTTTTTTTTTYGYLSDEDFHFAFDKIGAIRAGKGASKAKLLGKLRVYAEVVSSYQRQLRAFGMFLKYLDNNVSRNVHKSDVLRIVELHQVDYVERLNRVLDGHQLDLKKIDTLCGELVHYTPGNLESLGVALKKTDASISELRHEVQLLDSDVTVLKRNVGFFYRQKVKRLVGNREEVIR